MRQRSKVLAFGMLVLMAGCSGQGPPLEPATPQIYDFRSEGTFPESPQVPAIPTRMAPQTSSPSAQPLSQGWRVQVFAGRSKDVASNMKRQLQGVVAEPVYLDYVEPYYKVTVGDCDERDACDTLLRRLRGLGSESAWVVPHTIHGALQP